MYITTAIAYTNGAPHIGHAYEFVSADILARHHRAMGRKVYTLTGTDEHGQKIASTAASLNISPLELCDRNAFCFQQLNQKLNIHCDNFIRTSDPKHIQIVQSIFTQLLDQDDIYLDKYCGWYNPREEKFIPETEAKSTNYLDPLTFQPYEKIREESYFFRLSKYQKRIRDCITKDFISDTYRSFILNRLETPLQDLSITRTSFNWGIPVPHDPKHVIYVWFDALCNYISGQKCDNLAWDVYGAPIHVIGKDILWFHSVIWPAMLLALNLPLPCALIVHGFVNDEKGIKMSKSLNNVVDPGTLLTKYPPDTIRYSFIRMGVYGQDVNFSELQVKACHNSELADWYGNLVCRVFSLVAKYCSNIVPRADLQLVTIDPEFITIIDQHMSKGCLS